MKKLIIISSFLFISLVLMACYDSEVNKTLPIRTIPESTSDSLARTPPLGWNSFDSYGVYLHYDAAMANLEAFNKKLKPYGYEYFVIDLGWYGEYQLIEGTMYPDERHATDIHLDEYGLYEPSDCYFSQGIQPIIDRAHELGIKIGLHIMRGIPRKAVRLNLPVKDSPYHARDIADTTSIAVWCPHNYGVDMSKPGAQDWYNSVFQKLADWGVDFVKVDDIIPYPEEIVAVGNAIKNTGRPMVYSLSPGQAANPLDFPFYRHAHMVRITHDIWDRRADLDKAFEAWKQYQLSAYPGFWPDLDMIPFGPLKQMSPKTHAGQERDVRLAGYGFKRICQLNQAQQRTFITQRALAASPLFVGGDLPSMDDYSLSLLTDKYMLACNQNGVMGVLVFEKDLIEVWHSPHKDTFGSGWIGIFNRNEHQPQTLTLNRNQLGLLRWTHGYKRLEISDPISCFSVWEQKSFSLTDSLTVTIGPDDVLFFEYEVSEENM